MAALAPPADVWQSKSDPVKLFGFLKHTVGYDGWISVEEFSRTGEQGVRGAVRFVRDAWAAA